MSILMVTGIEGARNCAAVVGAQLGKEVEVAEGRKAALAALRRREFSAVVVDETMAECDPAAAEAIWEHAGLAIPVQINFALSGAADTGDSGRIAPPRAGADTGSPGGDGGD
jgi:DNA-binding NtrC family response regulator